MGWFVLCMSALHTSILNSSTFKRLLGVRFSAELLLLLSTYRIVSIFDLTSSASVVYSRANLRRLLNSRSVWM